jgi:hypothetical protein
MRIGAAIILACLMCCSASAGAQVDPAEVSRFARQAGELLGRAISCNFPKDHIDQFQNSVLAFKNQRWPSMRLFVTEFNGALRKFANMPNPDWMYCQDEVKTGIFIGITNPELLLSNNSSGADENPNVGTWNAEVGIAVCRQVFGTSIFMGQPVERVFDLRGYIEAVSGPRLKIMIVSITYPRIGSRNPNDIESLTELAPLYTRGIIVWEEKKPWTPCGNY